MTNPNKEELISLIEELEYRKANRMFDFMFPDEGKYARKYYKQHVAFMNAGKRHNQRAFIAANRVGKSFAGAYEMTCHLTGLYPHWWEGKKFDSPIDAWAAGVTNESTKDVIQEILFGSIGQLGTGMIPKDLILSTTNRPGVPNAIGYAQIQHASGGISTIGLKSYVQGRETFQGTKKQFIWLDEEPADRGIFTECLTRTAGDKGQQGQIICTFTPLFGMSDIVLGFMKNGKIPAGGYDDESPHKFIIQATWEDVPHISEQAKKEMLSEYSQYEIDARSKGIPSLGSGAIYPLLEEDVRCKRFKVPDYWPRAYALDYGWDKTAILWGAKDPDSNVLYIYSEYYIGKKEPSVHASAIKAHGDWIMGVADAFGRSADGEMMIDILNKEGLFLNKVQKGNNSVEPGIQSVYNKLSIGQLKIFDDLVNFWTEYRIYRRDEKGNIVKKDDHLMDALRYLVRHFDEIAFTYDEYEQSLSGPDEFVGGNTRNPVTGY